ncbi:AP2-like ethylene-responsive transcription factor At2g41710 [Setaria italica]|uniref:AP2-like ethylene-responsive transcription factor At2g41710 n=1 Tax=Setaria italica TaxID=4555 RepID=UPI000350F769|nr:AP2-like ethylene-responsive transcription factor At2g41710 [Setaria italica]
MAKPRARGNAAPDEDPNAATGVRVTKRARRKSGPRESPSQRSSAYRGVTRHRWTGRFEAHLWDKDARGGSRGKKGKQVYLGAYDDEDAAARAHDLAALKYWGPGTVLNFPLCGYDEELKEMEGQPREEYIGSLRRRSSGFSRGVSKYRGVARHHHNGRWEARIGRVLGNKYLYLGTYATQEEAAVAYDIAAIEHRGLNAVTNFDIGHYVNHWHRHRRGAGGGDSLGAMDAATPVVVPFQLPDDLPERPAATGLNGTMGAADLHDGEDQMPHHACSFLGDGAQLADQVGPPAHHAAPTPSALDLLLQSPKFKEMMEQVSEAAAMADGNSSSSAAETSWASSSSSSPPQPLSPQRQPEISGGSTPARCSFPDDVQTFFDFENETDMGFTYAEVDTFLFGDLGEYAAPMFQYCELDV